MNLSLRKVRIHPDMSEETTCFSADVYLEARRVGQVKNDGRGACNSYYWDDREAGKAIEEWADKQPTEFDFEKLDQIIDDLLSRYEVIEQLKRRTKKVTWFRIKGDKKGEWRTLKAPFDQKVKEFILSKYGDIIECIANENLEKAADFC